MQSRRATAPRLQFRRSFSCLLLTAAVLIVGGRRSSLRAADGRFVGQSPPTTPTLTSGDHHVRVVKDGYLEHSRVVTIRESKPNTLKVQLTRRAPQNAAGQQGAGLKIVVIEGEDAVNIIQQKTAVAPVVEVRDRNNQPVAGAVVRFAIQGGRATFNGARTLTVTTNVAGRAAVSGLTPTASGAFQISASAAFQGQTAVAMIAQTNVLTLEAAAASSSGAAAGGVSGSGGLSNAAIAGIAGGAGAVGAAVLVVSNATDAPLPPEIFTGQFTGQGDMSFTTTLPTRTTTCVHTRGLSGTLTVTLQQASDGTVTGTAASNTVETVVAVSAICSPENMVLGASRSESWNLSVTGSVQTLTFSVQHPYTSVPFSGGLVAGSRTLAFSGALTTGVLSGTVTLSDSADGTTQGFPLAWRASTTTTVTLR